MSCDWKKSLVAAGVTAGAALGMAGAPVQAEEVEKKVSGSFSLDYNTHFISYGFDVWGAGDNWGGEATFNPMAEVAFDFDAFTVSMGAWGDIHDTAASSIGGNLQEVDWWVGVGTSVGDVSLGATYQEWIYGGQVETIIDLSVGYDDSELLGDWAMSPSLVAHHSNKAGGDGGWAYVLSGGPSMTLIESEDYPLDLSIPLAVAFGDSDFYGESGYAYFSVGAQLSMPLSCVPAEYGDWSLNFGVTYYNTEDNLGNPEEDFITGNVGVAFSF